MKALIFIDHDIICRHFLSNGALRPLIEAAETRFVFPDENNARVTIDLPSLALGAPVTRLPVEAKRVQLWRWALFADQLKLRAGAAERELRRLRRRRLGWRAATMLTFAGLPGLESLFERWHARRLRSYPYDALCDLLDREKPDVIVHPSVLEGVFINDLVEQGRLRNIPVVVIMNSWDNPSTKRAVVGQPDWLLVWGPQTQRHAKRFMKMDPDRVVSFGAAQFDVYREKPRTDRSAFAARHDIDPRRVIVLFAGSTARTDEFGTLMALDRAIENRELPNTVILYRPHPWGEGGRDGNRFSSAKWRHVRIHDVMQNYVARLSSGSAGMILPDYHDTNDLLSAIDVVVSPLSTMLIEGMLHGKPVIAFMPTDDKGSKKLSDRMPQIHFEEFLEIPDVGRADSIDELTSVLKPLVIDQAAREARGARLAQAATQFVTPFERPWNDRMVAFLRTVTGEARNSRFVSPSAANR